MHYIILHYILYYSISVFRNCLYKCCHFFFLLGASPNDLPFKAGEKLVIIEPSKEIYWYLARNSKGKTGLVPVTYLEEVI